MTNNQLTDERIKELMHIGRYSYHVVCGREIADICTALEELQERRKADSEPVATLDVQSRRPDGNKFALVFSSAAHKLPDDVYFLYRHAQPAPVVLDDTKLRELFDSWFASDCSFDLSPEASEADNIAWRESYWYVWQRCRAAMLQESQKSAGVSNNCRSNENMQDMQDMRDMQAGNSPVIPEGYVMVPKEPTAQMYDAGDRQMTTKQVWDAMLAAAPQEVK